MPPIIPIGPGSGEIPPLLQDMPGSIDPSRPNFLFMTSDDQWAGGYEMYDLDPNHNQPATYVLTNVIAQRGLVFTRALGKANCSPYRASRETGRYGMHTGIGDLAEEGRGALPLSEVLIAKVLGQAGWATGLFGKWHLSSPMNGEYTHPILAGYDYWRGTRRNLIRQSEDFYHWRRVTAWKTDDGAKYEIDEIDNFATSQNVDDAIEWISEQTGAWFVNLNFNAPHSPAARPPAGLYDASKYVIGPGLYDSATVNVRIKANMQAVDAEIGRLLRAIDQRVLANTHVIFATDNGSDFMEAPFNDLHGKRSMYEQGIRLPLLWMGPRIDLPGRQVDHWFQAEDHFPTIAELAGIDLATAWPTLALDGISHVPIITSRTGAPARAFGYTEAFAPNGPNVGAATGGKRMVARLWSDGIRYKLLRNTTGTVFPHATDEFYNITTDTLELTNLTPGGSTAGLTATELAAYNQLKADYIGTVLS